MIGGEEQDLRVPTPFLLFSAAHTSAAILREVAHRLMTIEARTRHGWIPILFLLLLL